MENKTNFENVFPKKHTFIPAVHVYDTLQTIENIKIAKNAWADWVFLVDHEFETNKFMRILEDVKKLYKDLWIWVNMLWVSPEKHFELIRWMWINWVRVDNPYIKEINWEDKADLIEEAKNTTWFDWLYFWWVAFKHQNQPQNLKDACEISQRYMDIITTSWPATWQEIDKRKVDIMKSFIWKFPLAIASWLTPENITKYIQADVFIVSTWISDTFYTLNEYRVKLLAEKIKRLTQEIINN